MTIEAKDIITLIGISVSLVVGFTGLYISFLNSKKTIFINSVTSSRTRWIEIIRNTIAEYCGLSRQIYCSTTEEKLKKLEKVEQLKILIKLQLNRNDPFDSSIMEKVDSISKHFYDEFPTEMDVEIEKLINLTQDLLKLEWEGIKEESKKGNLSRREKKKLYYKYLMNKENENE
jgi:hypothetical protein